MGGPVIDMKETGCCPLLKAGDWNKKVFKWRDKPFYRTSYLSIFHIPLNLGSVITKTMSELESKKLVKPPILMLSKEDGLFSSTMLISLARDAKDLPVEKLTGEFTSMLFEGDYKDTGKWVQEILNYVQSKGKKTDYLLFWYGTCPKCAKEYGKAQTVIFAKTG